MVWQLGMFSPIRSIPLSGENSGLPFHFCAMSAEVILTRLGLLAGGELIDKDTAAEVSTTSGDEEADLLPHFQKVYPVLLDLIAAAGRTGQDADLLEHAKECVSGESDEWLWR